MSLKAKMSLLADAVLSQKFFRKKRMHLLKNKIFLTGYTSWCYFDGYVCNSSNFLESLKRNHNC